MNTSRSTRSSCANGAAFVQFSIVVFVAISLASCSGPNRVDILLECPSPDQAVKAVLWAESGGGAAGWSQQFVSIQPSDVPIERTPDRRSGEDAPVLAVSSGETFEFKWETNDRLFVTAAYSDSSVVYSMRHSQTIGGRRVRLTYRELEAERNSFSLPKSKCESGSQRIVNPPSNTLK
jgi:hypothetical protein